VTGDLNTAVVAASRPSVTEPNTWIAKLVTTRSNANVGIAAYAICV
jgi:hypothetical protein